jgi:hypothetical protein
MMIRTKENRHLGHLFILIHSCALALSACKEAVAGEGDNSTPTPRSDSESLSRGREATTCLSPNVTVTEFDVGVPVMGNGREGGADSLPVAIAAQIYATECGQTVGHDFTTDVQKHDYQSIKAYPAATSNSTSFRIVRIMPCDN